MSNQTFFSNSDVSVWMPEEIRQSVKNAVFRYIGRNHYRGIPRQENGEVNPYQYCYGIGRVLDAGQIFGGMVSGYPTQAFQHYAPHFVEQLGNPWISEHVANIYRIVAHYPNHADALLSQYETKARARGIKVLYSLPTKAEKDAVCNFGWFERNGFDYYAETETEGARFYLKRIAPMPTLKPNARWSKKREQNLSPKPIHKGEINE